VRYFDVYRPLVTPPRNGAHYLADEQNVVVFNANSRRWGQPFGSNQSKPVICEGMDGAWNSSPFFSTAVSGLDFDYSGIK
jgi:hypothetical protein